MKESVEASKICELLERGDLENIAPLCREIHPADLAECLEDIPSEAAAQLFSILDLDYCAEVLSHLDEGSQEEIVEHFNDHYLVSIITHMSPDERVDLIQLLHEDRAETILRMLAKSEREDILRLSSYQEGTAGAIMTSDYARLSPSLNARQALDKLRLEAPSRETIYYAFVIDPERKLLGSVSLKDLILANLDESVSSMMEENLVTAHVEEDQEEVARKMAKYDLIAIPVIDNKGALAGIVTFDDAADVTEEETTFDFQKMAPIVAMGEGIKEAGIWSMAWRRSPWLLVLVFVNIFSGAGIAHYEATIEAVVALVFFLPLLIASGGNAGSQSTTLMIRALATGEVQLNDWYRLLGRELAVALALGITMGLAVSVLGLYRAGTMVACVVAISMVIIVLMGSIMGMSLPFLLTKMGFDPAAASAPLVTSLADIAGVLVYLGLATWFLGL